VSITPEANVVYLEGVERLARQGAQAVANAMAKYIAERTRDVTLQRASHGPGEYYKARPGAPPARASGNLARSMFWKPASGGLRSTALVGNSAPYARILEFGCVVTPQKGKAMHWVDSEGSWFHTELKIPPHPYLGTTTEEALQSKDLHDIAIAAFEPYDP
jgi:phage gpG-like protein